MTRKGYKQTPEAIANAVKGRAGYRHSEATKRKMSISSMGNTPPSGKDHWKWSGLHVKYTMIHRWLRKTHGSADKCENIGRKDHRGKYEYAKLRNRKYLRRKENFIMLCSSCHTLYDHGKINIVQPSLFVV